MLATLVAEAFDKPGWVFEEKYDGDRILAYKEGERVTLLSRNGKDRTERFFRIAAAVAALHPQTLLLDGAHNAAGAEAHAEEDLFLGLELLQQGEGEPVYAVFDCLYHEGKDLRPEPLSVRRAVMESSLGTSQTLVPSSRLATNGLEAFHTAKRRGYEGLVAKDLSSPYVEARSAKWLKVKVHQEDEFVICGYTKPAGSRQHFGALLLGAYCKDELRYVGKVGTGFDEPTLAALYQRFQPLVRSRPALVDPPREKGAVFIEPKLVAQISYQELTETSSGRVRHPAYLGLRDDKSARDVLLPEATV